eukprot:CAMPEP_0203848318 /NCGR_PEP_ID=MMETSP0359-20131031/5531_1 /ASSEMBLY_ACC=CAM_ASM_000338 /TAXON_ID=268821 /ORGANISM="Scrippsiella Hangoei, Strain SHTV-5" /LENGTH=328 /DNA_ID=CAMNT_0050763901 /DNA_START=239 /DNA_END=1224 /DNA_ORIENTATION=-
MDGQPALAGIPHARWDSRSLGVLASSSPLAAASQPPPTPPPSPPRHCGSSSSTQTQRAEGSWGPSGATASKPEGYSSQSSSAKAAQDSPDREGCPREHREARTRARAPSSIARMRSPAAPPAAPQGTAGPRDDREVDVLGLGAPRGAGVDLQAVVRLHGCTLRFVRSLRLMAAPAPGKDARAGDAQHAGDDGSGADDDEPSDGVSPDDLQPTGFLRRFGEGRDSGGRRSGRRRRRRQAKSACGVALACHVAHWAKQRAALICGHFAIGQHVCQESAILQPARPDGWQIPSAPAALKARDCKEPGWSHTTINLSIMLRHGTVAESSSRM